MLVGSREGAETQRVFGEGFPQRGFWLVPAKVRRREGFLGRVSREEVFGWFPRKCGDAKGFWLVMIGGRVDRFGYGQNKDHPAGR